MVGSSVGALFTALFKKKDTSNEIPTQKVLNYKLSELQRKTLLPKGYTLVEYDYPQACYDCERQKGLLEGWVAQSDNQIYLQEGFTTGDKATVTMASYKGTDSLTGPTDDEIRGSLCDLLAQRALWCVEV
ncbi:hypothetical protein A3K63_03345 [Candidatus Micrarchaeota archaeon RBG_16_49_10]|nr:MAG: hypothetical protein A3K63_03345 [Candidatus Micrarchaeota archaeon RBG_16_49_10]